MRSLAILSLAVAGLYVLPVNAQDHRARTLHDTYCIGCHDSKAYTRKERLAMDYAAVRAQVTRWQANIKLNWSEQDIDLVSNWLAQRFYKVPCPDAC